MPRLQLDLHRYRLAFTRPAWVSAELAERAGVRFREGDQDEAPRIRRDADDQAGHDVGQPARGPL